MTLRRLAQVEPSAIERSPRHARAHAASKEPEATRQERERRGAIRYATASATRPRPPTPESRSARSSLPDHRREW